METKAYYHLMNSELDDNTRLEMAIRYATDCHQGQTRKGTRIPFIIDGRTNEYATCGRADAEIAGI